MDTLCKLLTVLVITFIIYPESSDTSCEQIQKQKNKTIQVCGDQSLTSNEIHIDSDGAPDGDITCSCTMERSQKLTIIVKISSRVIRYGDGKLWFEIPIDGFSYTYHDKYDLTGKQIVLQDSTNITFRKTATNSALCLSLEGGGSSDNFTVKCYKHELVAQDTTIGESEKSSTLSELPTTRPSTPQPVDQGHMQMDSLPTVLSVVIVSSAAAVLLATSVAAVIICRKRNVNRDVCQRKYEDDLKLFTTGVANQCIPRSDAALKGGV